MGFKNYWDNINPVFYDDECWFLDNCYIGSAELDEDEVLEKKNNLEELALNAFTAGCELNENDKLRYFQDLILAGEKIQSLESLLRECVKEREHWYDTIAEICGEIGDSSYEDYLRELEDFKNKPEIKAILGEGNEQ